jgi:hypothetical protein
VKIDFEVSTQQIGESLARSVGAALTKASDEAIRYGSLGREIKSASDKAVIDIAAGVLADPAFRAQAAAALRAGILRGIEGRGEKIAKGMPLQQALDLAALRGTP